MNYPIRVSFFTPTQYIVSRNLNLTWIATWATSLSSSVTPSATWPGETLTPGVSTASTSSLPVSLPSEPAQSPTRTTAQPTINPSSGLSTGVKAGIGFGAVLGVLLIAVAAFLLGLRWRKRKQHQVAASESAALGYKAELDGRSIMRRWEWWSLRRCLRRRSFRRLRSSERRWCKRCGPMGQKHKSGVRWRAEMRAKRILRLGWACWEDAR